MTLQSMTGFARASAERDGETAVWELKSVNGKGLEARLRLPPGHDHLEQAVRQAVQRRFSRGNVQVTLTVSQLAGAGTAIVVNEEFLKDLADLARRLQEQHGAAPARADGLLALRGVLEPAAALPDETARQARSDWILACLDQGLASLEASRLQEGDALRGILSGHVDAISELTERAAADPSREPSAIRSRLEQQVRLLLDTGAPLDETRLNAEAAFLATKADISEEIDRLRTHVASARAMLRGGGVVGRRLDFLSQEFNRESNTLCSKSNAAAVTAIGLELKAVIDQFREQVQNVE